MPRRAPLKKNNELKIVRIYSDSDSSFVYSCATASPAEKLFISEKLVGCSIGCNKTDKIETPLQKCFLHVVLGYLFEITKLLTVRKEYFILLFKIKVRKKRKGKKYIKIPLLGSRQNQRC
jgi:hypothetical protein